MVVKKTDWNMHIYAKYHRNRILLLTGGGATCRHYAWSIHVVLVVVHLFVYGVTDGYK